MAKTIKKDEPKILSSNITVYNQTSKLEDMFKGYISEFASLTSDNIKFYLQASRKGINFFKALLFEEIKRRDLRIAGLCQTRKLSVLAHDWTIEGSDNSLVEFVQYNLDKLNFEQLLSDFVEAQIQGYALFQLSYQIENSRYIVNEAELIPNHYTLFINDQLELLAIDRISTYELRMQANNKNLYLPTLEVDPIYLFEAYAFEGYNLNGLLNGVLDSIIYGYFFKSYGLKDWSVYLERFATPGVVGRYDPLMSKQDRDTLWNAINNFGNLFRAIIPNTTDITAFGDANKTGSSQLYSDYIKFWNDELSIRILGQAMTTDTGQAGSYAKALVGDYVRQDIKAGDLALITRCVNELIKKIVDLNFANVKDYPKFSFTTQEDIDNKLKKADLLIKLQSLGYQIDEEEIGEAFEFAEKKKRKLTDKMLKELFESIARR